MQRMRPLKHLIPIKDDYEREKRIKNELLEVVAEQRDEDLFAIEYPKFYLDNGEYVEDPR